MKDVFINKEHVELFKILKFEGIASSGAEAKDMIALIRRAMGDDWQPGKPLKFDFGPIGKKAVSKESNEVFNWVKSKSSKSTTGKKVTTGEDTDFWKTIE